jgi:hypothetical protein
VEDFNDSERLKRMFYEKREMTLFSIFEIEVRNLQSSDKFGTAFKSVFKRNLRSNYQCLGVSLTIRLEDEYKS